MMNMKTTLWLGALVALAACAEQEPNEGTQIGLEGSDGWTCEEVSSEAVSDLTLVQEGFQVSAGDAVAAAVGYFVGTSEQGEAVLLHVVQSGVEVMLIRTEAQSNGSNTEMEIMCEDRYEVEVTASIESDSVQWESTLALSMSDNGGAGFYEMGPEGLAVMPDPTTFNKAEMTTVEQYVSASLDSDGFWDLSVGWGGELIETGVNGVASYTRDEVMRAELLREQVY